MNACSPVITEPEPSSSNSLRPRSSVSENRSSSSRSTRAISSGLRRQLGIRLAQLLDDDAREAVDVTESDALALRDGAADDPPQDVSAALVRRRHAVRHEEGHTAPVVGEDPVRLGCRERLAVPDTGLGGDPGHDLLVAVRVVHGRRVLEDRRAPLETEARVDVLLRERRDGTVRMEFVLHEDEVPELEEALAARARWRAVRLAAPVLFAPVPVDLRVGPARPRSTRLDQKFSELGSGTIRSRGMPIRVQRSIATSSGPSFSCGSPACTVTHTRSQSSFMCSWTNSRANAIAPSLKYCPNEKFPSISKKVR